MLLIKIHAALVSRLFALAAFANYIYYFVHSSFRFDIFPLAASYYANQLFPEKMSFLNMSL